MRSYIDLIDSIRNMISDIELRNVTNNQVKRYISEAERYLQITPSLEVRAALNDLRQAAKREYPNL